MLVQLLNQTTAKEWKGKGIEDFVSFFNDWLTFVESPDNVQKYIDPIYDLLNSTGGRDVLGT